MLLVPAFICPSVCRVDAGLDNLAPDLAQQLEEAHREGPDLSGMAVVPRAATSGNPSATLLRLGFLGHVSAQHFADPVALSDLQQAQHQAADAVYSIFPHSTAYAGLAAALPSKKDGAHRIARRRRTRPLHRSERDLLCSMRGHHAIAQAALRASGTDEGSAAEVPEHMREVVGSLLQDTQVLQALSMHLSASCRCHLTLQDATHLLFITQEPAPLVWGSKACGQPRSSDHFAAEMFGKLCG